MGKLNLAVCKEFSVRIMVENGSSREVRPINIGLIKFLPKSDMTITLNF